MVEVESLCRRWSLNLLSMLGIVTAFLFMAHAPEGFWPILNQGELAVLYSFVILYLAVAGGGPWSMDRLLLNRD